MYFSDQYYYFSVLYFFYISLHFHLSYKRLILVFYRKNSFKYYSIGLKKNCSTIFNYGSTYELNGEH